MFALNSLKNDDVIVIVFPLRHRLFYDWHHLNILTSVDKTSNFDEKGIIPLILVKYHLNRSPPWQQGNVYT